MYVAEQMRVVWADEFSQPFVFTHQDPYSQQFIFCNFKIGKIMVNVPFHQVGKSGH
jgi:hypothetical protein